MKFIKKNPGLSLASANLVLVVFIFFLYDPFALYSGGYSSADSVLALDVSEIESITVSNPSFSRSVEIRRADPVHGAGDSSDTGAGEKSKDQSEDEKIAGEIAAVVKSYSWQYKDPKSTGASWKPADPQRVAELLTAFAQARKYYSFEAAAENLSDFEMGKNESGVSMALHVSFKETGGDSVTYSIGRAPKYSQSYVRIANEDKIYLAEQNLRVPAGAGDPEYFRNRDLFEPGLTVSKVNALNVYFENGNPPLRIVKAGADWQMVSPSAGKINSVEFKPVLQNLVEMRISDFPDKLPADLDKSYSARAEILYNKTMAEPVVLTFDILGQKGYSDYIVEYEGNYYEITSVYLEDLYKAQEVFLENPQANPATGQLP